MPSPVGHSLIGLAVSLGYFLRRGMPWREIGRTVRRLWLPLVLCMLFANAPDIDYVPGIVSGNLNAFHHLYTHTLGWIFLLALGTWMIWRAADSRVSWGAFLFLFVLGATHLLADWITEDCASPYGVMGLWPFTDKYYISSVSIFAHLKKADWADVFQLYNIGAVIREALVTLPLVVLVLVYKRFGKGVFFHIRGKVVE